MEIILYIGATGRAINCIIQATWFYLYIKDRKWKEKI